MQARWIGGFWLSLLAMGAGCTVVDLIAGDPYVSQDLNHSQIVYPSRFSGVGRFSGSDNQWVGLHAEKLTAALGPPDSILEAKPKGGTFPYGIHVLSYIYYGDRSSRVACIDTYVVVEATGIIVKYYCR